MTNHPKRQAFWGDYDTAIPSLSSSATLLRSFGLVAGDSLEIASVASLPRNDAESVRLKSPPYPAPPYFDSPPDLLILHTQAGAPIAMHSVSRAFHSLFPTAQSTSPAQKPFIG